MKFKAVDLHVVEHSALVKAEDKILSLKAQTEDLLGPQRGVEIRKALACARAIEEISRVMNSINQTKETK